MECAPLDNMSLSPRIGHRLCLKDYEINGVDKLSDPDKDIINFSLEIFHRTVSQLDSDSSWTKIAQPELLIN